MYFLFFKNMIQEHLKKFNLKLIFFLKKKTKQD